MAYDASAPPHHHPIARPPHYGTSRWDLLSWMFNRFYRFITELIVVYVCLCVSVSVSWILVRSSACFLSHHLIGPQLTYFHPGRRYYHNHEKYTFKSCEQQRNQHITILLIIILLILDDITDNNIIDNYDIDINIDNNDITVNICRYFHN